MNGIDFVYKTSFEITDPIMYKNWISNAANHLGYAVDEIVYSFMSDDQLLKLNVEFLQHDTLTDILTFDSTVGKNLHLNIAVSVNRVKENAQQRQVPFDNELQRVMIHGILHACGYNDNNTINTKLMRQKEDMFIEMFHVEPKQRDNV